MGAALRRAGPAAVLALPFLAGIAALEGLTQTLHTFHWQDEHINHLPTILDFGRGLPDLAHGYHHVPNPPLFHLLFAAFGKLAGFELWRLRLLEVAISYAAVVVLYRLLRSYAPLSRAQATLLSLTFALSPYFFGTSFILLTDNLGWLFGLLALERLLAFSRRGSARVFAVACLWGGLAVLTRQSWLWLFLLAALVALRRRPADAARLAAPFALALAPFAALAIAWDGFVPPGADPTTCGLCAGAHVGLRPLRPLLFTLALVGLYGAAIFGPPLLRRLRDARALPLWPLAGAAAAGVVLLLVQPMRPGGHDAGYLWRWADHGPTVAGSSWAFWLLVPLGCVLVVAGAIRLGAGSAPVLVLATLAVPGLVTAVAYQRYFDPYALLPLLVAVRPSDLRRWPDAAGVLALAAGFVAYALTFSG